MSDREKLIETMARAYCRANGWDADEITPDGEGKPTWVWHTDEGHAALTAIEAAGYRLISEHEARRALDLVTIIVREERWQTFIEHLASAAQEDSTSDGE